MLLFWNPLPEVTACAFRCLNSGAWSRGSGGGEEREWSEKTAGGDPPQGDQFNRTILGQLAYKWSSSPDAPTDENTGADCVPRSCRGRETEDDHGESSPSVTAAAAAAAAAAAPQADIYIMCPPSHKRLGRCCSEPWTRLSLVRQFTVSSGVMTELPTVARRPALTLDTRSVHAKHWRPITTFLRGLNK